MKTKYVPPTKPVKAKRVKPPKRKRTKPAGSVARVASLAFLILESAFVVAGAVFVYVVAGNPFVNQTVDVTVSDGAVSVHAENPYDFAPLGYYCLYLIGSAIVAWVTVTATDKKHHVEGYMIRAIVGSLMAIGIVVIVFFMNTVSVSEMVSEKLGVMYYDDENDKESSDLVRDTTGMTAPSLRDDVVPVVRLFGSEATSDFYKIADIEWNDDRTAVSYRFVPTEKPVESE